MTSRYEAARRALRRPAVADAALALTLGVVCGAINTPDRLVRDDGIQWWLWLFVALLGLLAVGCRRRWPMAMFALSVLVVGMHAAQDVPLMIVDLALPITLYTVATRYRRRVSLALLVALLAGLSVGWTLSTVPFAPGTLPTVFKATTVVRVGGVGGATRPESGRLPPDPIVASPRGPGSGPPDSGWAGLPLLGAVLIAAWAVGSASRSRRAYLVGLHARAAALERDRDQQAALAVAAERARISRELHDVVAHGLSVIVIQAQGGAAALDRRPADTRAALDAIVSTGRGSLADMRRVLAQADESDHRWHPAPGLARLPALLDQVRTAGTDVRLLVHGTPAPLPAPVDLSAYRIVQEALTNTMKHASGGATAEVSVSYRDDEVAVEIVDDGVSARRSGDDGGGHGLRGMDERVRLLGGRLLAGPRPDGGFAVRATIPIGGPAT